MCLAIPGKIVALNDFDGAQVDIMGVQRSCSVRLTPGVEVGDYVLVHAGYAIQRIEEQDADETLRLLSEMPDLLGDEFADELVQASGTSPQAAFAQAMQQI